MDPHFGLIKRRMLHSYFIFVCVIGGWKHFSWGLLAFPVCDFIFVKLEITRFSPQEGSKDAVNEQQVATAANRNQIKVESLNECSCTCILLICEIIKILEMLTHNTDIDANRKRELILNLSLIMDL